MSKNSFFSTLKFYRIIPLLLFAILLYFLHPIALKLLCLFTLTTPRDGIYEFYDTLVIIGFLWLWAYIAFTTIRSRAYFKKTGRNYQSDHVAYKRDYFDLVKYFKDADALHLDVSTLPTKKWTGSGGLVFGNVKDKLISFEPKRNGICAMVWGAPGDGKTTSIIIPSCRQFGMVKDAFGKKVQKGSVMVTDLKGDIYEANKSYRRIKRFSTIHWRESAHYDPLVTIRTQEPGERAVSLVNLAITLIPDEGNADSKFFVDGAREFFTGISLYLLNLDDTISFPEIIEKIVIGNYVDWVTKIKDSEDVFAQAYTNQFFGGNEKNVAGTYSKLVSSVRLFSSGVLKVLLKNDENMISPSDLEQGTDIYIQIDPNQITMMAPLIAMLFQNFMSAMLYRCEGQEPPIAFIMDEFGQIPAMPVISQSAALMRAYNCSLLFSCQSLAMIDNHYGVSGRKLLMDCVKVNCFLSVMDPDTRDWASRLIGSKKVLSVSNAEQNSSTGHSSRTVSEKRERIYEPESFGDLPNDDSLIVYMNGKYVKAEKTYYFK